MQKPILNNSTSEEEKSVIHKLNLVIAMFFYTLEEIRYGLY